MMSHISQPGGYPSIIPYMLVADAPAFIGFLEAAFGAQARFKVPTETGGVMNAEITLGDGLIMLSDAGEPWPPAHLCHYVTDTDASYQKALAAGAVSIAPPETKEYGQRIAGIKDPAGNTWWICTA
jgi:uncharacterized glyoxalase superfamily protein PhnB